MRVICTDQVSHEWHSARIGIVTASRVGDAISRLSRASKNSQKGDFASAHWKYVSELAWERITGTVADHYVSKPMDIGAQYEGEARVEYWMRYGVEVDQTGFVLHPTLDYLGASPDGLVGKDGGLELKVPLFHTHAGYLESQEIPEEYQMQMYTNMLCCERQWWDFVSYCPPDVAPELPEEFRMFKKRLEANEVIFGVIEEAATITMEHVIAKVAQLREMYPLKGAPKSRLNRDLEQSILAQEMSEAEAREAAMEVLDRIEMTP